MMELDGCSSAASRNGAIASAGRPALSNSVANASRAATCCGAAEFGDWDIREPSVEAVAWPSESPTQLSHDHESANQKKFAIGHSARPNGRPSAALHADIQFRTAASGRTVWSIRHLEPSRVILGLTMVPILMRSPTSDDNCSQQAMSQACAVGSAALNRETCLHSVERVIGQVAGIRP